MSGRAWIPIALIVAIGAAGFAVAGDTSAPLPTREERAAVFHQPRNAPSAGPVTPARAAALVAQDDFDATHYLIDLDFNDISLTVSGSVTVTALSVVAALTEVPLDLAPEMQVSQVTRGGVPLGFTHEGDVLTIALDSPVANGQSFALTVTYSGSPVQRPPFDGFGWNKYRPSGGRMVWSLSQPSNGRIWWPSKDRPDDKALVEEWWTVRSSWTATGNGVLLGVDTLESGRKRFRWRPTHPLPTYLVSIAAADYVSFSHTYDTLDGESMPIDYYVYSEDLTDAQESFNRTPEMIATYADLFGEYPFVEDKYGMAAFPFLGGMEHSTNTSYGYDRIDGAHGNDFIVAHELAHQWFGDSVTPETADDTWLSEGFASYAEALWREHLDGPSGLTSYMRLFENDTFPGPIYPPDDQFNRTVYDKGAWVLHMLRARMGDGPFFDAMEAWHDGNRDGNGNTAQFHAHMESAHGESLEQFFQQWVYGEGQPEFVYGNRVATPEPGVQHIWVRVQQVQGGLPYKGPLQISVQSTSGDNVVHTVWNDSADQYYRLVTNEPFDRIYFDRANWTLKRSATWLRPPDSDGDGVPNGADNCPSLRNSDQADVDADLVGDACDSGEICNDGTDDDGDGLIDCADPECAEASSCIPEVCDDGSDNDHDNAVDCDDDECIGHADCIPEICDDGEDNNADGAIDCDDGDCATFHGCIDEICTDAADNDGDGDADCADDECSAHTDCIPEICDDGSDNDGDGTVDCDDTECAAFHACVPEICGDGFDNDGDGGTDCADDECASHHTCITEICNDATDNDGDGATDCADDECAEFSDCIPEVCGDGIDNDGDGFADCADGECVFHHTCLEEICANGADDDGDGLTDCDDEECSADSSCIDEICGDGQDNDGDGLIDCDDPECADASACISEICDDAIDNDGDGLTDCADSECIFDDACIDEVCGNGFDDDGDGLADCADDECVDYHACIAELCDNGTDDDGDGLTDCADEECVDVHSCIDEICDNASDDDMDGSTDCADDECGNFHGCIDEVCDNLADDDGDGLADCADEECSALPECIAEICGNETDDDGDGLADCDDDECADLHDCIDEVCDNLTDDDGDGLTDCADEECSALPECIAEICDDALDNDGDGLTDCDDDECAAFHDCIDEICDNATDDDGDGLTDCDDEECSALPECIAEICDDVLDNDGDGLTDCDDDECAAFHDCIDEICDNATDDDGDGLTDCDDEECVEHSDCIPEICDSGTDDDGDGLTDCDDDECAEFHGCIAEVCDNTIDDDGDGLADCDDDECVGDHSCIAEVCDNETDDDGDGLTDCADEECGALPDCIDEICDDGLDNDGDGNTDCDDSECARIMSCLPEDCTDQIDNNGNGLTDCDDPDCASTSSCIDEMCGDGIDNDGDGATDCDDDECAAAHQCIAESCLDNIDNDGDGLLDCADEECEGLPACLIEHCSDGIDNDGDGLVDCSDSECVFEPVCTPETCGNGFDDDSDGLIDCADDDCAENHACIAESCSNAIDDDGDGLTDCADEECIDTFGCLEEICDNGVEDDLDGLTDCDDEDCADWHECIAEVCDNEADDDGDGLTDCDDDECGISLDCDFETCDDGIDNDQDGMADCADPDCEGDAGCNFCPLLSGVNARGRGDTTCFEVITSGEVSVTNSWTDAPFLRTIDDPVLISGPPTRKGHDRGVIQIRNLSTDGFQARYMEWEYEDGIHQRFEDFPFLALPAGRQVLANGTVLEAGRFELEDTGAAGERMIGFAADFPGEPWLFLTPQSSNGSQPVEVRARAVTSQGFTAALYEEEQYMNQHGVETVGYLAVWAPTGWGDVFVDGKSTPFLLQRMTQNQQFTPVLSWNLRYDEEMSVDSEYTHLPEDLSILALGDMLFAQDVSTLESDTATLRRLDSERDVPIEWGTVRGVTASPVQVPLAREFIDPIVIVKSASGNGLDPGVIRIDGVAGDRFRVRFQEWAYLDGTHAPEDLFYLVVESGRHSVGGIQYEAGTLRSDRTQGVTSFDTVTFNTPYAVAPIVFTGVQTFDDSTPATSRIRAPNAEGFPIALQREQASTEQHGFETLGWVAFEEGIGTLSGRSFQITTIRATDRAEWFPFPIPVSRRFPSVVADIAGFRGFDPALLRYTGVNREEIRLFVQEETSFDEETTHLLETVSLFVGD